ncbi:PQQ-like beta-propeller repeat protein [Gemmata sp. G18]|uniref:PQQ-like beta-propeller repeat protein n=1 Tax=Gemmata palustris TaxID=2822762 RepID=A0ABS5BTJ5_9BACT|nr:PQQ-binding-like beta-propeller repeat protein [Gemmata palustris]MBP3957048.1 PQQ-like beta-propeller repeat protein [Gemmata palustris]
MALRVNVLACAVLLGAAAATVAPAADWPGFRGPNRDGLCTETGLLKKWPDGGPKQVWTAKDLGLGWGTPSVAEGRIFGIGTRDGKDGVWALKEADGTELWFTPFADPATGLARQTNGPASTPTYDKGKLFAVSANGTLSCLDATKGTVLWKTNYVADFGGKVPTWAYTDSVLIDGDKVICIPGGTKGAVAALKIENGDVVWKTEVNPVGGGFGYSSPVKATIDGVPMYIALLGQSSGVVGVHAETGKLLWQYKNTPAAGGVAQIPIPIVKGDKVWVSCSYGGGAALLQIVPKGQGAFEAKELKAYKKPQLNNHHGGMVLVGDYIYFGHDQNGGKPVCVDFKTGDIKWGPENAPAGGRGSAAVLFADGRLYFRYENGVMVLIEPSPEELKVVSSFKLPEANVKTHSQSWPHPVIVNGKLYIRDQNVMYCYDVKEKVN